MVGHINENLPRNAVVILPHPCSGNRQGEETFLTTSADKLTSKDDKECSSHHLHLTFKQKQTTS